MITSGSTESLKSPAFLSKMLCILRGKRVPTAPRGVGCCCKQAVLASHRDNLSGSGEGAGRWKCLMLPAAQV